MRGFCSSLVVCAALLTVNGHSRCMYYNCKWSISLYQIESNGRIDSFLKEQASKWHYYLSKFSLVFFFFLNWNNKRHDHKTVSPVYKATTNSVPIRFAVQKKPNRVRQKATKVTFTEIKRREQCFFPRAWSFVCVLCSSMFAAICSHNHKVCTSILSSNSPGSKKIVVDLKNFGTVCAQ